MKKIEIIWREVLFGTIEKKQRQFTQKAMATDLDVSTSTVFAALKAPRRMGAARVTGRFFVIEDAEKLLFHWASIRNLQKDIIFAGRVNLPVLEIEGLMPPQVVFACFSAARHYLDAVPADYDKVYVYATDIEPVRHRFEFVRGQPNVFVAKGDSFLSRYGVKTTLAQTFVDLWNLSDWQAKDFAKAIKEKIDEFLS